MSKSRHTIIIAEAGVNHNGNLAMAKALIDAAADAGADYVKFQTFRAEALVAKSAKLAEYQVRNIGSEAEDSQLAMLKSLQLSERDTEELLAYAILRGIKFMSTAFDLQSIDFLARLELDFWKVPSGEVTNYPYLQAIAEHGGKVIMSTGMCDLDDITAAINVLTDNGIERSDITLLHCTTEYPTPMADVNLAAMPTMAKRFRLPVGYSDHTPGIEVPIAAVALGASVIEKHFTLDRSLPGPDHKASLEPAELKAMVTAIRNIEKAIGTDMKRPAQCERKNMAAARKSIVAAVPIKRGEVFTTDNITTKRPGTGIPAMRWPMVLGNKAKRDFSADEQIEL